MPCLAQVIETACLLEATARKPGNVYPGQSFVDLEYDDFVRSARIVGPILASAEEMGIGRAVRSAAIATRDNIGRNTNLGILLLIAPLAAVPSDCSLRAGISKVLDRLEQADAALVYEAIAAATPGGMGNVDQQDVAEPPTETLVECMRLAADRDTIARQYISGFEFVFQGADFLVQYSDGCFEECWEQAVIRLQLELLSHHPDTLIRRKCGPEVASRISRQANVLSGQLPSIFDGQHPSLLKFNRELRLDGHRLNPGTTADLVAACLFVALRENQIAWSGRINLEESANQFTASNV